MTEEIFRNDAYVKSCRAVVTRVDERGVQLDRTVFYPMGGGQPGDAGVLKCADGSEIAVIDCRKDRETGDHLHILKDEGHALEVGQQVTAEIDWERRYRLMRMHSCLHVLCAVVPGAVTGGQIGDGAGRLDFDLPEATLDKEQVTAALNRLIEAGHKLSARWITDDEMAARPELVRTMSVKPPSGVGRVRLIEIGEVDLQPCGGTHVRSTAEIGQVIVTRIEKKGRQNRRVRVTLVQ
ncbi:MAG: alanyl-tRNA editing protein [Sphingomonadales bacterium]